MYSRGSPCSPFTTARAQKLYTARCPTWQAHASASQPTLGATQLPPRHRQPPSNPATLAMSDSDDSKAPPTPPTPPAIQDPVIPPPSPSPPEERPSSPPAPVPDSDLPELKTVHSSPPPHDGPPTATISDDVPGNSLEREKLLEQATIFLETAQVRNAPDDEKRAFLVNKGLTEEEVNAMMSTLSTQNKSLIEAKGAREAREAEKREANEAEKRESAAMEKAIVSVGQVCNCASLADKAALMDLYNRNSPSHLHQYNRNNSRSKPPSSSPTPSILRPRHPHPHSPSSPAPLSSKLATTLPPQPCPSTRRTSLSYRPCSPR